MVERSEHSQGSEQTTADPSVNTPEPQASPLKAIAKADDAVDNDGDDIQSFKFKARTKKQTKVNSVFPPYAPGFGSSPTSPDLALREHLVNSSPRHGFYIGFHS